MAETDRIFTTERKKNGGYTALSTRAVQQMVQSAAEDADIKKRVHPHLFRHSAITDMIRKGMHLEMIRRIVGHADLTMISTVYSHVDSDDLYEAMLARIRKDGDQER